MKIILGSGVVGLLAKFILGDDWTIIPFYKSRFYSYNPPLDDNFIIASSELDPIVRKLGFGVGTALLKRAIDVNGQLVFGQLSSSLYEDWLLKVFGQHYPSHAIPYLKARTEFFVYGDIRVNKLYNSLINRYSTQLKAESVRGQVASVHDHELTYADGSTIKFDQAVSTIPLNVLLKLAGLGPLLQYKPMHLIHMRTNSLNFEGASQVFSVDRKLSFYKVSTLAKDRYLFYCHEEIPHPGMYFMPFLNDFDLLDGTKIDEAIPLGERANPAALEKLGFYLVGSYAQHDWCADVGSNILNLVRYGERGFVPRSTQ